MRTSHCTLFLALLSLAACSDDKKPAGGGGEQASDTKDASSDHGDETNLGTLTVAGHRFGVIRLGELIPGKEGAFEVHPGLPVWRTYAAR